MAPASPTAQSAPKLKLNPPAQPAPDKKRSPSLFERITGGVQEKIGELTGHGEGDVRERREPAPQFMPSSAVAPQSRKAPPPLSQGSLNIDSPSKPAAQADDELDIPAFLRRQAN